MKYIISLITSLLLYACGGNTSQNAKEIEESVLAAKEEKHVIDRDTIKGDFNGDGKKEYAYLTNYSKGDVNIGSCITFSNSKIPLIEETGSWFSRLTNEGDLNEDGADEIGFLAGGIFGSWQMYNVLSFRKNKWHNLVHESIFVPDIDNRTDIVKIHPKKQGYLLVQTTEWVENDSVSGTVMVEKSIKIK